MLICPVLQPAGKGKAGLHASNLFRPENPERPKAAAEQGSLVLADKENVGLQSSLDLSESVDEVCRTRSARDCIVSDVVLSSSLPLLSPAASDRVSVLIPRNEIPPLMSLMWQV